MKLTSVELHPAGSSDVCVFSFRDPSRANPFVVKTIAGLDASVIIPHFYGGSGSAPKFYTFSIDKRDVVIKLGLNPDYSASQTFSSLRDELYKIISSSRTGTVQIQFKNGTTVVAVVTGFVTKFEASHFDKAPEVQITLNCPDPVLRAPTPDAFSIAGLSPAATALVDSKSTAPHGFDFTATYSGAAASLVITDPGDSSWSFTVTPSGGFLTGDVLHFSSEYNNKQLYVVRSGVTIYLADKISPGSVWPILFPGTNNLSLTGGANIHWTTISHSPAYWGV